MSEGSKSGGDAGKKETGEEEEKGGGSSSHPQPGPSSSRLGHR